MHYITFAQCFPFSPSESWTLWHFIFLDLKEESFSVYLVEPWLFDVYVRADLGYACRQVVSVDDGEGPPVHALADGQTGTKELVCKQAFHTITNQSRIANQLITNHEQSAVQLQICHVSRLFQFRIQKFKTIQRENENICDVIATFIIFLVIFFLCLHFWLPFLNRLVKFTKTKTFKIEKVKTEKSQDSGQISKCTM